MPKSNVFYSATKSGGVTCSGYLFTHLRSKRYLSWIEFIYRGNANQASITLKELFEFSFRCRNPITNNVPLRRR